MCFSPSVSFGASAFLATAGAAAMYQSSGKPQRVLAGVPLLFAIQQFAEGVVWMSLLHTEWAHWKDYATYTFLLFAQVIWPVYMPFCALLFEHHKTRKKIIDVTLLAGLLLAAYTTMLLALHVPHPIAEMHHIHYELDFALARKWYYGLLYFIPTILSLVLSSHKALRRIGYLFLISYIFTRLLFHFYVISIWCFFGAAISLLILLYITELNKKKKIIVDHKPDLQNQII